MDKTKLNPNERKNSSTSIWGLIFLLLLTFALILISAWMILAQFAALNRNLEKAVPYGCVRYVEKESPVIYPPKIIRTMTHREMIEFLRREFPHAMFRGVEEIEFKLITEDEIERFLRKAELNTLERNSTDCVIALGGLFSTQPSWGKIPVGWVKSDNAFYAITIVVMSDGNLKVLGIDCKGEVWEVNDTSVKFVFVG